MRDTRQEIRRSQYRIEEVLQATAQGDGVNPEDDVGLRSGAAGRDVAAYLCRRYSTATLAELSDAFGLSHRDRSGDLLKRARRAIEQDKRIKRRVQKIEERLRMKPARIQRLPPAKLPCLPDRQKKQTD